LQNYTNAATFPTGVLSAQTTVTGTLPSNLQVTPYLKVSAPAGLAIEMQTDHYTDGGPPNVRSTYITTNGTQEFESLGWMSGTTVEYHIPAGVQILSLQYRESGYDTAFAGSFTSSDPYFNTLWQKSQRSVYVNMRDSFMDCPTRERSQWAGDNVNEAKVAFYAFDSDAYALMKKGLSELLGWLRSDNTLQSPVPGNLDVEVPVQIMAALSSFATYYRYTGDSSLFTAANYAAVEKYMNLWTFDSDGLVNHRAGNWDWEDWGNNIDARVLDNAWYYMALQSTIQMADATGHSADVTSHNGLNNPDSWQQKLDSIAANFNRVLWDAGKGAYYSPGYNGDIDDRGNALAVVAGLADSSTYARIIAVLNSHYNASPYMELYVLEALYLMHDPSDAEARMKSSQRYAPQVDDASRYTLWEHWSLSAGTDDHGWGAGPLYVLSAYGVGVQPTAPGYSTYQVLPQVGTLTTIEATVPTIRGQIGVSLHAASPGQVTMTVTSPANTVARIGVPILGLNDVTISANGTTVYATGGSAGSVAGLTYAGTDTYYVYFTAQPGTWRFSVSGVVRPTKRPTALHATPQIVSMTLAPERTARHAAIVTKPGRPLIVSIRTAPRQVITIDITVDKTTIVHTKGKRRIKTTVVYHTVVRVIADAKGRATLAVHLPTSLASKPVNVTFVAHASTARSKRRY
jgi:alpha-L-rhamnosidase